MSAPPPVIFKRTKTKPSQRARELSPEKDVDNASTTADNSPSTLAMKLKNKNKNKNKSRLSFGGDDEEEDDTQAFKVKKSNLSRKMALGTHPASISPSLDKPAISSNKSPRYDAAYLQELKASTPSVRPPTPSSTVAYDADISMDLGDISMQSTVMDVDEVASFIPSESSILVAKEKRERLRKIQVSGADDFISLSVSRRDENPQGPHPDSRLVREEDELGEGDDEFAEYTSAQERIALGKKSRKKQASQRRDAMKEMIADAEEEDEETAEWEQEQLRRGGHRTPETSSLSSTAKKIYKPASIPPATPVPTLGPAISRLTGQLAQLTASHAQNSTALNSLAQERLAVDTRESEMREMVEKAEAKRAWFGSFREWSEDVAGFLDEKYPLLEKLEEDHLSLLSERSEMITKRRTQDDDDDLITFLGPLPVSISTDSETIDEHGRTIRVNPTDERRERRSARVNRRQLKSLRQEKSSGEEEGYSTDSSLDPPDVLAYNEALQSLSSRTKVVLADVKAEEFRDPGKGRWSTWREKYSDSYVGAWGGLGVVSVWEFWVRLESVGWDCIENSRSLHSFKWYKGLYEYSHPGEGGVVEERELGPDGDLVASMISTAVIPMLCKVVDNGALDIYSHKDITRMIDLAEEIEASVEAGSGKYQLLLKSVMNLFQNAIAATEESIAKYMNMKQSRPGFDPEAIPARMRFMNRRIKLLKNLLRWRKHTGERFGLGVLAGRLVESCIVAIAETGWEVGGEETARKVIAMLPDDLVPYPLRNLRGSRNM